MAEIGPSQQREDNVSRTLSLQSGHRRIGNNSAGAAGGTGRSRTAAGSESQHRHGVGPVIAAQLFCPCPRTAVGSGSSVCNPFLDTKITFNVVIIGEGVVDICGYVLTFTGSGGSITVGAPFVPLPSTVVATPDSGWIFSGWGGILSGSVNPTDYFFAPIECQNTSVNISATFVLVPP